jgi:DNA-directed RNA polymerase specialized sigma24 family protein
LQHVGDLQSDRLTPEELAVEEERLRIVRRLMLKLTHKQRSIVYLRLEGHKPVDIARSLGIRTIAVNALSKRALKKIRSHTLCST